MSFEPVTPPPCVGDERHFQRIGILHLLHYYSFHHFLLFWIDGEVEFVMNLQYHLRLDVFFLEPFIYPYHCHLDDVGCRSLYWCVDGISLGESPYSGVSAIDVGQVSSTFEEGLYISFFSCHLLAFLHVFLHFRERFKIPVNELPCFSPVYFQSFC